MYRNHPFSLFSGAGRRGVLGTATVAALVLGIWTAGAASAASTSPGKNSAFESSTGVLLNTYGNKLTATIAKGRKKTVLAIEASYSDGASYPTPVGMRVLGMQVLVNGVTAQPNPSGFYQYLTDCGYVDNDPVACTVTGTFWIDIDAAELANPGLFVGQPLVVNLVAGDLAAGSLVGITPMDASLTVRVQKK